MANEISLQVGLTVKNPATSSSGYQTTIQQTRTLNQNALGADSRVVSVPTAGATYTFTVATYGILYLQNLDAANPVNYGLQTGGVYYLPFQIQAGEVAIVRLVPGITFAMQAITAAVNISYLLLNN